MKRIPRQSSHWITNGILVTQDEQRRVRRANLRITDGRIDAITTRTPPSGAKVRDAAGRYVLPGFVQTHLHLCQTLFRNMADDLELLDWLRERIWVFEAAHTPATLATSAKLGIYELLSSGTTCVLDMGTVRHTHAILETAERFGIRGSFGKCLMDRVETTPANLRDSTQTAIAESVALFKEWNGRAGGRLRVSFAPRFAISCTDRLMTEIARLSRELDATVHTHASENQKEVELVRELVGADNVEYFHRIGLTSPRLVLAHCIWLTKKEHGLLARSGTHVAHCPSSNLKLASGIAPIPELLAAGVNVSLGADGAPCNNNLDAFREMRLAALVHKPRCGPRTLPAAEVLDLATRSGARALRWESEIGSIEVGKRADLIGIDLSGPENQVEGDGTRAALDLRKIASSLVYSSGREHLRWTMVDGNLLFSGGKVRGIPTNSLQTEVRSARQEILRGVARTKAT